MDANLQALRELDRHVMTWGQAVPGQPSVFVDLCMINDQIEKIASRVELGVSLENRLEVRAAIGAIKDHMVTKGAADPVIQSVIDRFNLPGQPSVEARINGLVEAIDGWSIVHWSEDADERRDLLTSSQLTPDQVALNRRTQLVFANGFLHNLASARGIDEESTSRIRSLIQQFPELQIELPLALAIESHNTDLALEFIAQGAAISDPKLLSEAVSTGDLELVNALISKYKEGDLEKLREALSWRTAEGLSVLDRVPLDHQAAPNTLYQLVQAYKELGLPPPSSHENGILRKISEIPADGARLGLFRPSVLELLQLMPIADLEKSLRIEGVPDSVDYWFSVAISSYLNHEPPDFAEALRWFQLSQVVSVRSPAVFENCQLLRSELRDKLIPVLNNPESCGPFLEMLGDLRRVLFNVELFLHTAVLDPESPLINWMMNNDPVLFATEMSRENSRGQIPLHLAVKAGALASIGKLPGGVLRTGLDRPDHDGLSPLWLLFLKAIHSLEDQIEPREIFEKMVQKLPPGSRALHRANKHGENMLHLALFAGSPASVASLAKYPQIFQEMAAARNRAGQTPLSKVLESPEGFSSQGHAAMTTALRALNIPATALDALQSSEDFVPWLQEQMRAEPPALALLMLPSLRGHPEEISLALRAIPEVCTRWFATEQSIAGMLALPQEIWQQVLAVRSKAGNTTLERLASQGNSLFWTMLEDHDSDLPKELLRQPRQYGFPIHKASTAGQVGYLQTLMRLQEDTPDFQRELLGMRDTAKRTALQCAHEAKNEETELFLLREVEIPLLNRDLRLVNSAVGLEIREGTIPNDLAGLRRESARLSLEILDLQGTYFNQLREKLDEAQLAGEGPMEQARLQPVFPSLRQVEQGALEANYVTRPVIGNEIEMLPDTVDFAGVLLPLIEQLPIDPNTAFNDEGRSFPYSQVKARIISVISTLAARGEVVDHYNGVLEPVFRDYITNILRHLARHVEAAQAEIAAAETPQKRKELQDKLDTEMRNELIGDFAIGFFNCVDGVAGHARQLYEHVILADAARVGSASVENQVLFAAQQYRRTQFDLLVLQVAAGNAHEATTLRHYRKLLGDRLGLGVTEMDKLDTIYTAHAVLGHEGNIERDFNAEHTPKKLVDYFCGLLNDRHVKTLKKSMVSQWFSDRFPTISPEQLQDAGGNWRPEAVALLLTSLGILKPKIEEVNARTVLLMMVEQGDAGQLQWPLANFRGLLPDGLLHAAVRRGDPAILAAVTAAYSRRGTVTKALNERDENGYTAVELAVREASPKFLSHLLDNYPGPLPASLLHHAVSRGDVGAFLAVKTALRKQHRLSLAGAYRERGEFNPFELAVATGRFDLAGLLLRDQGNPPTFSLKHIITKGNLASVDFALAEYRKRGAMDELNRSLMSAASPLDEAARLGKWDIVERLLVGHPMRLPRRSPLLVSPLVQALESRQLVIAERLLQIMPMQEIVDLAHSQPDIVDWMENTLTGERLEEFGQLLIARLTARAREIPDVNMHLPADEGFGGFQDFEDVE